MDKLILLDKIHADKFERAKKLFPKEMQALEHYKTQVGTLGAITPSKEGALVVVQSDILPTGFYHLDDYQEEYHKDLTQFLSTLFSKIGKKSFDFKMSRSQDGFLKLARGIKLHAGTGAIVADFKAEGEVENTEQSSKQVKSTLKHIAGDYGGKCSPKELQEWLGEQGIDMHILGKLGVANIVETFIREGQIRGRFKEGAILKRHHMLERIFQEAHQEQGEFQTLIGAHKGISKLFARGFVKKIIGLNLDTQLGGVGATQKQKKSYKKYALFYAVAF